MAEAVGQVQDRLAGAARDPGGDAEEDLAQRLGVATERRAVGRGAGGGGGGADVADQRGDVQGQQAAGQPEAVGVEVAGRQVPEWLAELCVLEALLDLGALAVEVLDHDRRSLLGGDVGDDEAVGVGRREPAVEHHLQLVGGIVVRRRALGLPRADSAALTATRRTIRRSGSCVASRSGVNAISATCAPCISVASAHACSAISVSAATSAGPRRRHREAHPLLAQRRASARLL